MKMKLRSYNGNDKETEKAAVETNYFLTLYIHRLNTEHGDILYLKKRTLITHWLDL